MVCGLCGELLPTDSIKKKIKTHTYLLMSYVKLVLNSEGKPVNKPSFKSLGSIEINTFIPQ